MKLLKPVEASEVLSISQRKLWDMTASGVIRHVRINTGQQVILGSEVVIDEPARYPRLFADLIDGKCGHTALAQTDDSRCDQLLPAVRR